MKKYIVILLMLVYGLPSTGASIYLHYCCGKLDDVSFTVKHAEGCMEEAAAEDEDCCNSVAIDLKLDTDQQPLLKWMPQMNEAALAPAAIPYWQAALPAFAALQSNRATGPPLALKGVPVYIKNCVFRI